MTTRTRIAVASALVTVLAVAGSVHAQFTAPTCTPPNCNPAVIQNVDISAAAQTANINISGSQKLGGTFQTGALAPVMTLASDNLMYGNVGATSTNGSLLLLQFGSADRLRVTLTGQMQLPLGSAGAPSYSFIGDTNTGLYSSVGDSMSFATNGVARTTINNSGLTVNSGVLTVPAGSASNPSITFAGDTNTGFYSSAADTINLTTNGVLRQTVDSTGAVTIPGDLTVNGTFTSGGVGGDGSSLTNLNASNITTGTLNDARLSSNVALLDRANQNFTGNNSFSSSVGLGGATVGVPGGTSGQGIALPSTNNDYIHIFGEHNGGDTSNGIFWTADNADDGWYFRNSDCCGGGTVDYMRIAKSIAWYQGGNFGIGTMTPGTTLDVAGMASFGSTTLVVGAGQNTIYGVQDVTSAGNLMLLQTESAGVYTDRFRVSGTGAVTAASFAGVGTALTALNASNLTSGTVPSARISGTYSNALTFSGANSYTNQSIFGSASLVVAAGQNLLYGNVDSTSAGNLLLLQNESADRFRVDAAGNLTLSGTITATGSLTSGGVSVCLQNGTNCPATLGGAGTANYITKFTGTGSTVGDSQIQDDGSTVGIGIAPQSAKLYVNGAITSNSTISTYQVVAGGVGVSGQVVGVGSTGVAGNGGSYGVYGSSGSYGVYGYNTSAGGTGAGVYGYGSGTSPGVQGDSASGWGGSFSSLYVTPGTSYFASVVTLNGGATLGANSGLTIGTGAGDISGANGRMFYNTSTNKFRCYENGAWKNCTDGAISTVSGSGAGISVSPTTGNVVVQNTGVTSAMAGAGISVSGSTGAVTITNTGDTNAADDFTGSGTANTVPKFTGAVSLGNSIITDNGATATIGGALAVTGNITTAGVNVCRQDGTNCPSATEVDTLATVTGRGATTATAISVNGGGTAISGTGSGAGVYGTAGSNGGIGVQGVMTAASGYGVYGSSSGSGGNGVYGNAGASNGIGVNGLGGYIGVAGAGPYGVYGDGASSGTYAAGVYGRGYHGVEGLAENNGYGVFGTGYYGVYGAGTYISVYANGGTYGVFAVGSTYAVYAAGNSYTTGTHTVGGDIVANWNTWGTGSGWYQCGGNNQYCVCPNGSFVGQVYNNDSWGTDPYSLQTYCYKP